MPSSSRIRALFRTVLIVLWVLLLLPFALLLYFSDQNRLRARLVHVFYVGMCHILSIRIMQKGSVSKARPLLIISNHISYLDIFVLGAAARMSFTPKHDVRSWPVIGFLCVLADCVFVERKPSQMQEAREAMQKRLNAGRAVCIFPEGTTGNGRDVAPFKSGFFSLTELVDMPVQPISIIYTHLASQPLTEALCEHVAWVGDATFFDHFWRVLGYRSLNVTLVIHPLQSAADFADRKVLSLQCETLIRKAVLSEQPT